MGESVMKFSELLRMSIEGHQEAMRIGLDKKENWTPLLVHIHTTRLSIGFALGLIAGWLIGLLTAYPWGR